MNKQLQALTMERRLAATRLATLAGKTEEENPAAVPATKPKLKRAIAPQAVQIIPKPVTAI